MANVNAQSIEDYADRIVYRYAAGRYEQALTTWTGAFSSSTSKTLVNTDTSRSYIVPETNQSARFYKIDIEICTAVNVTEDAIGLTLTNISFFKITIPSLNFDGKSQLTDFYEKRTVQFYTSPQLRAINIGDLIMEPVVSYTDLRNTPGVTYPSFSIGAGTTQLIAYLRPTVTYFKKSV
jgi:hypothetical protein